jgi:hypothetical protein
VARAERYAITPRHHFARYLSKSDARIAQIISAIGQHKRISHRHQAHTGLSGKIEKGSLALPKNPSEKSFVIRGNSEPSLLVTSKYAEPMWGVAKNEKTTATKRIAEVMIEMMCVTLSLILLTNR